MWTHVRPAWLTTVGGDRPPIKLTISPVHLAFGSMMAGALRKLLRLAVVLWLARWVAQELAAHRRTPLRSAATAADPGECVTRTGDGVTAAAAPKNGA